MAALGWLGSHDRWPAHSHNHVSRALEMARDQGWWLKPSNKGKAWGKITCKEPLGEERLGEDNCVMSILRTPSGSPEEQAKRIRRALSKCDHDRRAS
jgi:hypothetical protein